MVRDETTLSVDGKCNNLSAKLFYCCSICFRCLQFTRGADDAGTLVSVWARRPCGKKLNISSISKFTLFSTRFFFIITRMNSIYARERVSFSSSVVINFVCIAYGNVQTANILLLDRFVRKNHEK